jgi:hypothetical protein
LDLSFGFFSRAVKNQQGQEGDKLIGSFLAYDADRLKAALNKVPGIKAKLLLSLH